MSRALVVAALGALALVPFAAAAVSFAQPVYVTQSRAYQAAEPSIRVDAPSAHQTIWVAAPTGIGVDTRSLPAGPESGDLFWRSDDDGRSFHPVEGPDGVGSPTLLGGGDSDVATGYGDQVYGTGLTLANITLAASCDDGATPFTFNPISALSTPDDRQWIDTYEDSPAPFGAPDLVLTYGNFAASQILFNQIYSPACAPPDGSADLDLSDPSCQANSSDCYQWPGNVAVDERTGDAYVAYNTQGNPTHDKIIVARVDGGASRPATQADVHIFTVAKKRPDTFDSFVVVAVDRASNLYVVWSERHRGSLTTATMLSTSRNRGATWTRPVQVNDVDTTTYPWLVAGDSGRVDVVYYGTKARGRSPETVPDDSLWRVYMAQSTNALDSSPSYTETPATPFMHEGSICTSGTGCAPGTRDLLDFFQVDSDRAGWANIAYTDDYNTPPDGSDPHQEWVTFVQQAGGPRLFVR
jgi:hypothetical protein